MTPEAAGAAPERKKFGVDLGTTYSSVGWYNSDTHQVEIASLESADGSPLLPSAIFVESPENVVAGTAAIHAGVGKPERLFRWFKRDLGAPGASRVIDDKTWSPVECSTEILKRLKIEAEPTFYTEVRDVVITFPAWFDPKQKNLTKEAAVNAGLNVITMIEEPLAAAIAYIIDEVLRKAHETSARISDLNALIPQIIEQLAGKDRPVLVYDLGGGTFDVAMVQAYGERRPDGNWTLHTKVLYRDGDILLGGKNWDTDIKELVRRIDIEQNGHDPSEDPQAGRLDDECEVRKRDLSRLTTTTAICPKHHEITLTRDKVEEVTKQWLDKTRTITETVIARAIAEYGVKKENITLLLSGGMCRWPAVRQMLKEVTGTEPVLHKNVDFMVTYGAAYIAYLTVIPEEAGAPAPGPDGKPAPPPPPASISRSDGSPGFGGITREVPYPAIGVEVVREEDPTHTQTYVRKLIPTGTKAGDPPCRDTYQTLYDNQTSARITLFFLREHEGHKDDETALDAWEKYKSFDLTLPPKPRGQQIHVMLYYVDGGVIEGEARDNSGQRIEIKGKTVE